MKNMNTTSSLSNREKSLVLGSRQREPNTKLFTSQRLDQTGLYFYGERYYDATIGRFISPDVFVQNPANPQTLNRYSYCLNNPLRFVDPTGWLTDAEIREYFGDDVIDNLDNEDLYILLSDADWGDIITVRGDNEDGGGFRTEFVLSKTYSYGARCISVKGKTARTYENGPRVVEGTILGAGHGGLLDWLQSVDDCGVVATWLTETVFTEDVKADHPEWSDSEISRSVITIYLIVDRYDQYSDDLVTRMEPVGYAMALVPYVPQSSSFNPPNLISPDNLPPSPSGNPWYDMFQVFYEFQKRWSRFLGF